MSTMHKYGNDDSEVRNLLHNYRQHQRYRRDSQPAFPEFSAVRQFTNNDPILAASEVSWLEKITEQNHKICDQTLIDGKDDNYALRPVNSMKFSFNQNGQIPLKYQDHKKLDRSNTLRDIYFKQFAKESAKIQSVQKARKQIIDNIGGKRRAIESMRNKENLIGSIKRNSIQLQKGKQKKNQILDTNFGSVATPYKASYSRSRVQKSKIQIPKCQQYLVQSTAKRQEQQFVSNNHLISKKIYLQGSSNVRLGNSSESRIIVKQFTERDIVITLFLEMLFEQLDRGKTGFLTKSNCFFETILEDFKIVFGRIFVEVKFKNLTLNKQDFVILCLQVLKDLQCSQFNKILEHSIQPKEMQYKQMLLQNDVLQINEKAQNFRKKSITLTPSPSENCIQAFQKCYRTASEVNFNPLEKFTSKMTHNIKQQFTEPKSNMGDQSLQNYEKFKAQTLKNKENINNHQELWKKKKIHEKMQYKSKNYQSLDTKLKKEAQMLKIEERQRERIEYITKQLNKKKRNISQSMIVEHKRNLQDLLLLNDKVETHLTKSRRVMDHDPIENVTIYLQ